MKKDVAKIVKNKCISACVNYAQNCVEKLSKFIRATVLQNMMECCWFWLKNGNCIPHALSINQSLITINTALNDILIWEMASIVL